MEWIKNGAIPQYSLPLAGWTKLSIPGALIIPKKDSGWKKIKRIDYGLRLREEQEAIDIIIIIYRTLY